MTKKALTYEGLVEECKRLRGKSERAEAEFFIFLMTAERSHMNVWKEAGCTSFEQFLRSNTLCKPDRYRLFAMGADRIGLDVAMINGTSFTMEAGKGEMSTDALKSFCARAAAFVEIDKVAPTEETVKMWRGEVNLVEKDHSTIRKVSELHRLRAENQQLKAELAAAKKRIAELEDMTRKVGKKKAA